MHVTLMLWIIAEVSGENTRKLSTSNFTFKYFYKTEKTPRFRVLNGHSAAKDEYPYVVSLLYEEKIRAGTGSLITPTWILTAGHCLLPKLKFVKCGDMTITWEGTECKSIILDQILHPSYLSTGLTMKTDIALLRIQEITKIRVGRLHAADGKTFLGRAVRFAGFGTIYHSYNFGPKPREDLNAEDQTRELQTGDGVIFEVNEYHLSIAPRCTDIHQGPYLGDSGGPLLVDGKIVGVLSTVQFDHTKSKTFANPKHPERSNYTPVSPYLDWIKRTINSNNLQ